MKVLDEGGILPTGILLAHWRINNFLLTNAASDSTVSRRDIDHKTLTYTCRHIVGAQKTAVNKGDL